jgi:hypothetical protein
MTPSSCLAAAEANISGVGAVKLKFDFLVLNPGRFVDKLSK